MPLKKEDKFSISVSTEFFKRLQAWSRARGLKPSTVANAFTAAALCLEAPIKKPDGKP